MVVARLALAITALLALSGCVVTDDDVQAAADLAADQAAEHGFAAPAKQVASVLRAISNVSANVTGLNLTLSAYADGNGTLTYDVAFGDNTSANGTLVRIVEVDGNVTPTGNYSFGFTLQHAYNATGDYNLTVTIAAGNFSLDRTLTVTVGEASPTFGPVQDPIHLEGTVLCLPTLVLDGEIAGETLAFTVNEAQRAFALALAYDEVLVEDLDFVLTSPSGKESESAASGPEPVLDVELPEAGEWSLQVIGYSCALELSFTVDIVFAE